MLLNALSDVGAFGLYRNHHLVTNNPKIACNEINFGRGKAAMLHKNSGTVRLCARTNPIPNRLIRICKKCHLQVKLSPNMMPTSAIAVSFSPIDKELSIDEAPLEFPRGVFAIEVT